MGVFSTSHSQPLADLACLRLQQDKRSARPVSPDNQRYWHLIQTLLSCMQQGMEGLASVSLILRRVQCNVASRRIIQCTGWQWLVLCQVSLVGVATNSG